MKPFTKMVSKLEDLVEAHNTQITLCDQKAITLNVKCEDKVDALRDKAYLHTQVLVNQKSESISERIKAENAISMINKLTGEVTK